MLSALVSLCLNKFGDSFLLTGLSFAVLNLGEYVLSFDVH